MYESPVPSLGSDSPTENRVFTLLYLDPRSLTENPDNPRKTDDPEDIAGLAATIRAYGVLQPIVVTRQEGREGPSFQVVYGNRRRVAAIMAGLPVVPCLETSPAGRPDLMVRQLLENGQRKDLNPIEFAEALLQIRENLPEGVDDGQIATMVGLSPRTVTRYLQLLALEPAVRSLVALRLLPIGHAIALRVLDPDRQVALAQVSADRGLSFAEVARAVEKLVADPLLAVAEVVAAPSAAGDLPDTPRVIDVSELDEGHELPPDTWSAPEESYEADDAPDTGSPSDPSAGIADEAERDPSESSESETESPADLADPKVRRFTNLVEKVFRYVDEDGLDESIVRDESARGALRIALRQLTIASRGLQAVLLARGWLSPEEASDPNLGL